jgi:paraquat-inducible protein A
MGDTMIACRDCDLLQQEVEVPVRGAAQCARCGAVLYRGKSASLDHTLAYLIAAAILFGIANAYPLLSLDAQGLTTSTTIFGVIRALYDDGERAISALAFMTMILFPAIEMSAVLSMLVPLKLGVVPRYLPVLFRTVEAVKPWGMVSVFMLGALVSLVKLRHIAEVDVGIAMYALGGFLLMLTASEAEYDTHALWARAVQCA